MTEGGSVARPSIVFVRHGETDWNVAGRLQGGTDIPLNARGRDQAAAVGRTLIRAFPDIAARAFVASPLSRAVETMRLMRGAMGLDPEPFARDDRLREMSFGRWEGSTFREVGEREPAAIRARAANRWTHRPPDGESYVDLVARLQPFVESLTVPCVIVAHGGVARGLLAAIGGADTTSLPEMRIHQGRAILFEQSGWRWSQG